MNVSAFLTSFWISDTTGFISFFEVLNIHWIATYRFWAQVLLFPFQIKTVACLLKMTSESQQSVTVSQLALQVSLPVLLACPSLETVPLPPGRYLGRSGAIFSTRIAVQITTRPKKCRTVWTHSASEGELHMTKGWFQFSRSRNRIANLL